MSDRRTIVLVVGVLAALVGLVVIVVAAIRLQDPVTVSGEIGERRDATPELIAAIVCGLLLVLGGLATAIRLVRSQLR
jgi:hypothetical protein